jgi:hypothetical protein
VREQPALAHAELGSQTADGDAVEAHDRRELNGGFEDRLSGATAAFPAAVEQYGFHVRE